MPKDGDGASEAGAVHVLFLRADGSARAVAKLSHTSVAGLDLAAGDQFGVSVAALGDLDGDSVVDLAVGAYYDDDGAPDAGAVHVLFLKSDGSVSTDRKFFSGLGLVANDRFGHSVAALGDLDRQGMQRSRSTAALSAATGGASGALKLPAAGKKKGGGKKSGAGGKSRRKQSD